MDTDIVSANAIIRREIKETPATPLAKKKETILPGTSLPSTPGFGSIDLWKIKSKKNILLFRNKTIAVMLQVYARTNFIHHFAW